MAKILTDEEMITLIGQYMTGMQRTVNEEEIDNMLKWAEGVKASGDLKPVLEHRAVIRFENGGYVVVPLPEPPSPADDWRPVDWPQHPCDTCPDKVVDDYGYLCNLACGKHTAWANYEAGASAMLPHALKKGRREAIKEAFDWMIAHQDTEWPDGTFEMAHAYLTQTCLKHGIDPHELTKLERQDTGRVSREATENGLWEGR